MIANRHYLARFTNRFGEEWEFRYDPLVKEGFLTGSDVDWQTYRVLEGKVPELILSDEEVRWLQKEWAKATRTEIDE